jgi:hypothetical protein
MIADSCDMRNCLIAMICLLIMPAIGLSELPPSGGFKCVENPQEQPDSDYCYCYPNKGLPAGRKVPYLCYIGDKESLSPQDLYGMCINGYDCKNIKGNEIFITLPEYMYEFDRPIIPPGCVNFSAGSDNLSERESYCKSLYLLKAENPVDVNTVF